MCSSCGCGSGKGGLCVVCCAVNLIMSIVGVLATLAALYGVYRAHFEVAGGFGSQPASLTLIALFIGMMFTKKAMKMCPCNKKACGAGCGAGCGCGKANCNCGAGTPKP